jgi:protein-L-isoaspartate(D-aspartate) O-methyltransferase
MEDFEIKMEKMVEFQLRQRGINDPSVLKAIGTVPRHLFVKEEDKNKAYEDHPILLESGQTISQPYIVGLMTQELHLTKKDKVLEIGTGSGYQTAILAELSKEVYTVERLTDLFVKAKETLKKLNYKNIFFKLGDGSLGWIDFSLYDKIIVTAGNKNIPEPLISQLKEGGVMLIPVGDSRSQILTRVVKKNKKIVVEQITTVVFVPLVGQYGWN